MTPRIDLALNPYVNAVGASWAHLSREERATILRDMQGAVRSLSELHYMLLVAFLADASDEPAAPSEAPSNVVPFPKRAAR